MSASDAAMAAAMAAAAAAAARRVPRSSRVSVGAGATSSLARVGFGQLMARRNAATRSAAAAIAASWFSAAAARSAGAGGDHGSHAGDTHSRRSDASKRHVAMAICSGVVAASSMRLHAARRRVDPRTWHIARPSKPPVGSAASSAKSSDLAASTAAATASEADDAAPGGRGGIHVGSGRGGTAVNDDRGGRPSFGGDRPSSDSSFASFASPSFASIASIVGAPNLRSICDQRVPSRNPLGLSAAASALTSSASAYAPHADSRARSSPASSAAGVFSESRSAAASVISTSSSAASAVSSSPAPPLDARLRFFPPAAAAAPPPPPTNVSSAPIPADAPEGCDAISPHGAMR